MVEVIHSHHGHYPFGLEKLSENTFVLILKENLSEEQISLLRQKCKIYKEITSSCFIKLHKMLKEDNKLHLHFQYYPLSLEKYIEMVKNQGEPNKERCKALYADFNSGIDCIIDQLVKIEVKTDLFIWNMAVTSKSKQSMKMKVFIEPQSQFLSLIDHNYRIKDSKRKDRTSSNQQFLHEFYDAERKRLNIEFQQLLEQYLGKYHEIQKKQRPNFVINGTKLTFLPSKEETAHHKIQKHHNKSNQLFEIVEDHRKIRLPTEQKNQSINPTLKPKQEIKSSIPAVDQHKKEKIEKIINFDQSFQPEFKPQEFTKENTFVLEQNDYLQSLEQQLVRLASEKKLFKNQTKQQINERVKEDNAIDEKKINRSQKSLEPQNQSSKPNSINNVNNNSNSNLSNNSKEDCIEVHKSQPKDVASIIEEKIFKYKMKIITSHQIEIEGGGQPNVEEIEREIMQGLQTGKLNINDIAANRRIVQAKSEDSNRSGDANKSRDANTSNQNSKQMSGSTYTQKSIISKHFHKDPKDKIVHSSYEGAKKQSNIHLQSQVLQTRSSDLQQPKMKSINDIIQKIGIRTNQINQAKIVKQAKQLRQQKQAKICYYKQGLHSEQGNTNYYKLEKNEHHEQKVQKCENYLTKIREAKEKAEILLREYAKKKQ